MKFHLFFVIHNLPFLKNKPFFDLVAQTITDNKNIEKYYESFTKKHSFEANLFFFS